MATDGYKVRDCETIATDTEIIDFTITDYKKLVPELYEGNNHIAHKWIRVDVDLELFVKNKNDVWVKADILYRQVDGPNGNLADTNAKVDTEIKLGET